MNNDYTFNLTPPDNTAFFDALRGLPGSGLEARDPLGTLDALLSWAVGFCDTDEVEEVEDALAYFEHLEDQVAAFTAMRDELQLLALLATYVHKGAPDGGVKGWTDAIGGVIEDLSRILDAGHGEVFA